MRLGLLCLSLLSAASLLVISSPAEAQKPGPASKPAAGGAPAKTDAQDPNKKDDPKKPATENTTTEDQKKSDDELIDTDKVEATKAIYFSGDLGFTRSDLGALSDNTGFDRTAANGVLYGLAAGYRVKAFRVGLRWRVYDTTEFSLWTVAASAGYALPLRPLTPIFSAHVGYVFDQKIQGNSIKSSLPEGNVLPPDVDVKGLLVGLDANASYWVTKFLRLGVFLGADVMFLHRSKAPFPQSLFGPTPEIAGKPIYTDSGSGIGLNVNLGIRGAFDIGLQ